MAQYEVTEGSTVHGLITPHGRGVPHRMPAYNTEENLPLIMANLAAQLYPSGRVFNLKRGSNFDLLHRAINRSFIRLIEQARLELDGNIPDNDNFTEADATLWEYRLGLITNPNVSLQLRRDAIRRKFAHPGNVRARQHPRYIQSQLQQAGFNVFIHENTIPYRTPEDITGVQPGNLQHGGGSQHGENTQHGTNSHRVIANSTNINEQFAVGSGNLWATFFIGGQNLGDTADIPQSRALEFRELVLKLKPAHLVAFTFINYT